MNAEIRFIAAPLGSRDNPAPIILLFLSRLALPGICCRRLFVHFGFLSKQEMHLPASLETKRPRLRKLSASRQKLKLMSAGNSRKTI